MALHCTFVSELCPVGATLYGYYSNPVAIVIFVSFFGSIIVAQFLISLWKRTWTFPVWVFLGCAGEVLGYTGRIRKYIVHQTSPPAKVCF